jgi:hypothetical protein
LHKENSYEKTGRSGRVRKSTKILSHLRYCAVVDKIDFKQVSKEERDYVEKSREDELQFPEGTSMPSYEELVRLSTCNISSCFKKHISINHKYASV